MADEAAATTTEKTAAEESARVIPISNLDMTQLMQLDACTRCGECLNWCPVYDQDKREEIIPRKKIFEFLSIIKSQHSFIAKLLASGKLGPGVQKFFKSLFGVRDVTPKDIEAFVQSLYECSTCGQCHIVCPANIDTVNLWEKIRESIVTAQYGPLEMQKALIQSVKAYDNPWQQPRVGRSKWAKWAEKEKLIAKQPAEIKKNKAKILLFIGCTASFDVNVNKIAINTANILDKLGIEYGFLGKDEKCCGSVLKRMGDAEFERIATDNIKMFNKLGIEMLITSCAGCFNTIRHDYGQLQKLNFEVLSISQFLVRLLEAKKLPLVTPVEKIVTYHDPCHLGRANHVYDEPRAILKAIPGLELLEMERNFQYSRCCGAGGGVKAGFPAVQNKMAQARIREAEGTGASELVSACPFCYQGLQVGVKELNSPLTMRDITELVTMALGEK